MRRDVHRPEHPAHVRGIEPVTGQEPPMRRRVRATLLRGLVRSAGVLPESALRAGLRPMCRAGMSRRYSATIDANLDVALPGLRELCPDTASKLTDRTAFKRDVATFAAEQGAHWIRLARGATRPQDPSDPSIGRSLGSDPGAWVDERVELDRSIARLDESLAGGRGAIIVTAHIGDWELLCARLRRRGQVGAVVGRVRRNDPSHRWLTDMRLAYGVETIAQDASARRALRVVKGGGVLGLLSDLRVRQIDGRTLPFLGAPARVMTAPASFARALGLPLVPVRCVRPPGAERFVLSVDEPLFLRNDLPREAATDDLLMRQNEVFARWICETPEQWAWHQKRWPDASLAC